MCRAIVCLYGYGVGVVLNYLHSKGTWCQMSTLVETKGFQAKLHEAVFIAPFVWDVKKQISYVMGDLLPRSPGPRNRLAQVVQREPGRI